MRKNQQLRLIEQKAVPQIPKRTFAELWPQEQRGMHSLHYVAGYHGSFRPELPSFLINRYSCKGETVLDPFCGRGTTMLEANLLGRVALGSDLNPVGVLMSRAKGLPIGLDEVVLRLNEVDFSRPVDLTDYREGLGAFYHPDTYRELVNLKRFLQQKRDRVNRFIELLAVSRLHGHTAGYFSTYTAPQKSLLPHKQLQLNLRRRETPEYRAVVPRIIRRAAQVLQDGFTGDFFELSSRSQAEVSDCRQLGWLSQNSVDLIVSGPPLPECVDYELDQWLEYWFLGLRSGNSHLYQGSDLAYWREFVTASLREMLRVLKPGCYAALALGEVQSSSGMVFLEDIVAAEAQKLEHGGKRFRVDEVLVHQQRVSERAQSTETPENGVVSANNRIIVLQANSRGANPRPAGPNGVVSRKGGQIGRSKPQE